MTERKFCERCGRLIGDAYNTNYYAYIRMKYCPACKEKVTKEQTALRVKALRNRKKQKDKFRDEQLELLKEENELLRKNIVRMREQLYS